MMERATFLDEESGQRISCLVNPDSLQVRREAGVRRRTLTGQGLASQDSAHDALLFTSGGRTEIEVDLLFDIDLLSSAETISDIREVTQRFAQLGATTNRRSPCIRLLWGRAWNVPCVVRSLAERLERFTPAGQPQRSWMRLLLWQVEDGGSTIAGLPANPPLSSGEMTGSETPSLEPLVDPAAAPIEEMFDGLDLDEVLERPRLIDLIEEEIQTATGNEEIQLA